jgi:hypothetical protein
VFYIISAKDHKLNIRDKRELRYYKRVRRDLGILKVLGQLVASKKERKDRRRKVYLASYFQFSYD